MNIPTPKETSEWLERCYGKTWTCSACGKRWRDEENACPHCMEKALAKDQEKLNGLDPRVTTMDIEVGFRGKLEEAILLLQSMSSNDCGDLSRAQSALLRNALQMLRDLEEDYADPEPGL